MNEFEWIQYFVAPFNIVAAVIFGLMFAVALVKGLNARTEGFIHGWNSAHQTIITSPFPMPPRTSVEPESDTPGKGHEPETGDYFNDHLKDPVGYKADNVSTIGEG